MARPMSALNSALAWRNQALELELQAVKIENELKEKSWIRDYADLLELNQRQIDFTDEVLVRMSQKQREKEQVEQHVKALQVELRKMRQEREQVEQHVKASQVELRKMRQERQQVEQHVKALQVELRKTRQEREHAELTARELQVKVDKMEKEAQEMKRDVEELVRFNLLLRENQIGH